MLDIKIRKHTQKHDKTRATRVKDEPNIVFMGKL